MVKPFTTGARFLGKYKPEKIFPVLYLIPESSGRAFKMRCKAFGIPDDPHRFLCRTISDGVTLLLDDPIVLKAVQEMKPIVFLDTMIRFSESKDENSSAENQAVAKNVLALRAAGAVSVIGLHHATKAFAEGEITLEACLRGTGDIAALCDSVYALRRDRAVFDNGNGPEELDVACVKDRDIKNPPKPFRIAARYIKNDGTRASFIDETGDFHLIESSAVLKDLESKFIKIVAEGDPTINREDLAGELGITEHALRKLAKQLGWSRPAITNGSWALIRKSIQTTQPKCARRSNYGMHSRRRKMRRVNRAISRQQNLKGTKLHHTIQRRVSLAGSAQTVTPQRDPVWEVHQRDGRHLERQRTVGNDRSTSRKAAKVMEALGNTHR
jgi:hypothetical protein